MTSDRKRIFMQAKEADADSVDEHLVAFANSFIVGGQRDRWVVLLRKRTNLLRKKYILLENFLDKRFCSLVEDTDDYPFKRIGVFYNFFAPPVCITGEDALTLGYFQDAVYSIEAGKLALLFSHEGRIWRCVRD